MPFRSIGSDSLSQYGFGLDIGGRVVKSLLAKRSAERVDVESATIFSFDPSWVSDGVVRNPKALGCALRTHLSSQGVEPKAGIFSIPSQKASLRWVQLPDLEGEELRDAARFKVKRHLSFPVEDAYLVATRPNIESDEEKEGASLVIAVRRDLIDSRADTLEYANIEPLGAELEAQALLRIAERKLRQKSALWRDASLTIIDFGSSDTHMYVVQNQRLQFMRGIPFGTVVLGRRLAQELDIDEEEATKAIGAERSYIDQDGMLHVELDGVPARASIRQELGKLTNEFVRLLRYFRSLHPERSYEGILDHMIVCGGLAGVEGLDKYLETALGLRVELAQPFLGMVGRFSRDTFDSIVSRQEAFAVVLGLALSAFEAQSLEEASDAEQEFAWAAAA